MKIKVIESFSIYHDLTINACSRKVFEAITKPDHLVNWWPLKCTGNPEVGGEYNFYFNQKYDWFGKVVEYSSNKEFHIRMTKSNLDWAPTTFGFDIEDFKDNVQLKFWHTGWAECNAHYRKSSYCWAILLKGLKEYLEKGVILPFEERG